MGKTRDIREAVELELDFDPLVDASCIVVDNVRGAVALTGSVASYPQYLEAAAAARRVAGVGRLSNHLHVVLPDGDVRDDPMLTTAANNALAVAVLVPDGIEAAARDGVLTLTGVVDVGTERSAAVDAVSGLIGVRGVDNLIEIVTTTDPVDVVVNVQDALDRYSIIGEDSDVRVETDDNSVTLTGNVATWAEHDAVVDAAWRTRGVHDVRDELVIAG